MAQEVGLHWLVATLVLVTVVLCLGPAAHGSPPDPTWIAGFYDNADFDDVVLLITSNLGVVDGSMVSLLDPQRLVMRALVLTDSDIRALSPLSSALGRAPPII
jgi:hypothetical protein